MGFGEKIRKNVSTLGDVFRSRKFGALFLLGFASGLPIFLTRGSTLQSWMKDEGIDIKTVGLFSLISLPYTFKFLWAPLLDRFQIPWLGRRRGWLALSQIALVFAIFAMGATSPQTAIWTLAGFALLVAFLSASQDVVADGYRADVLEKEEIPKGTSTFLMAYRIACSLIATSVALILSDYFKGQGMSPGASWRTVYWIMAALMGIGIFGSWLAPEPQNIAKPPKTISEAVVKPFGAFFRSRGLKPAILALLFISLYYLADVLLSLTTYFYKDLGFSNTEIGTLNKMVGFFATIGGYALGSAITTRVGTRKALWVGALAMAISNLGYVGLAFAGKSYPALVATITLENTCSGISQTAFITFLVSLCDKSYSVTQYALLSSASSLSSRIFGGLSGYLVDYLGWHIFFVSTLLGAVPSLILLALLPKVLFEPVDTPEEKAATGEAEEEKMEAG